MTSDGSDETGTDPNPQPKVDNVDQGAGGEQAPVAWDKVAEAIRETTGADLPAEFKSREEAAAAGAAKAAGQKAQELYDPRIQALADQLQRAKQDLGAAQDNKRLAEIAAMPKEKQDAARELLKGEKSIRELSEMKTQLFEAAKTVTAEKTVLALAKRGITAEVEDFMQCATPDAMESKAASMRVSDVERQLEEVKAGKKPEETKPGERQPPAVSQRAAPKKGATGAVTGQRPWEALKGKGLGSLGDALRSMREADTTGE